MANSLAHRTTWLRPTSQGSVEEIKSNEEVIEAYLGTGRKQKARAEQG